MAQVSIIYGRLGQGKTYFATRLIYEWWKRGRRQYCTFATPFAKPLATLAHAWCPEFAHSDFTFDESAATFNAREYKDLDPLSFGALTHARHQDVRVRLIAQDPQMLDANFRRLADEFIEVKRIGPSGDSAVGKPRAGLFHRPWWFVATYRGREAFDDGFVLKPGARVRRRVRFRFDARIAQSYDTHNHFVPPTLSRAYERLAQGAAMMAAMPNYVFVNGVAQTVHWPKADLYWPVPYTSEEKYKELDGARADQVRLSLLSQLGFSPDGEVDPFWSPRPGGKAGVLRGRVDFVAPVEGVRGAVEVSIDGQAVVVPVVAFGGRDPFSLSGLRIRCAVRVYEEDGNRVCCLDVTQPVQVEVSK